jgi:hypothetical protein
MGKYNGDTQVSGITSKSKQVMCYKIKNIVRGRVWKNELVSYRQMNSSIHSVWCYGRNKKQVSKKLTE